MAGKSRLTEEERKLRAKESKARYNAANKEKIREYDAKRYAKTSELRKEYSREYYAANSESRKEYSAKYRIDNKEKVAEYLSAYRSENKDKRNSYNKKWREENPDKAADAARRWRENNLDKVIEYSRTYVAKNLAAFRIRNQNRRCRIKNNGGTLSKNIADKLLKLQDGKCACCKKSIEKSGYHMDHIIPLALGGENSDRNIQLLCKKCNCSKKDKHPVDFMRSRGYLI